MFMIRNLILIVFLLSILLSQDKRQELKKIDKKVKKKKQVVFSNNESSSEYLDLFDDSFKKLKINFVDSVNESELIKSGIKGMLKKLDPYTKLLEGSSLENYQILTKGKYGGVGIQIGLRRDTLTVLAPLEDSPAYSEGIQSGDKIIKIDSTFTFGMDTKGASELIKGEMGTKVTLGIYRPATKEKIDFILTRDNITVKHVPYWGIDIDNVGYIRLTKFSKNASKDFKTGLIELNKHDLEGLVIDLRGNSGGLLSNAIRILDALCDRGEVLLTRKGKTTRSFKEYYSKNRPILDIDIPIVVLVNKSSASASEIVAGALQDLDRAVILGQKTFGKGLVQNMYELNDTLKLKITTSKYYLPSGRLIQKEDYLNNGFLTDGLDVKDSLFTTKGGRNVKGGGGIIPDVITEPNILTPYIKALYKEGVFLGFAASYAPFHRELNVPISIDSKILDEFKVFLNDYKIDYNLPGEKEYKRLYNSFLKSPISINKFSKNISYYNSKNKSDDFLGNIEEYYTQLKSIQFSLPENQRFIKNGLARELSRVISGEKERIRVSLDEDKEYIQAKKIILNLKEYYSILEF